MAGNQPEMSCALKRIIKDQEAGAVERLSGNKIAKMKRAGSNYVAAIYLLSNSPNEM